MYVPGMIYHVKRGRRFTVVAIYTSYFINEMLLIAGDRDGLGWWTGVRG